MAVKISYDSDCKMQFEGLECSCPCKHSMPTQDIYVGKNLIARVPEYIRKRGLGENCVLVCDKNTYAVAGKDVYEALTAAGFKVEMCLLEREGEVQPDERSVGEVLLSIQPETQFLVAVGSGSITDTTRVNAARTGLPFVSVGTAPSMDGYTSVVAPLLLRGLKIHRNGPCPEIIVCDLGVLSTAPLWMIQSGVGDVLGKYIAIADWKIGNIINDEPYCPACGGIVLEAVDKLLANIDAIRNKAEEGMRILIEALLLAGITIMIVGHTRAVASIEHNVTHFIDMKMLERYGWAPSHGATVGVCTLLCYPMFKRFAQEDISGLDISALAPMSAETRREWMLSTWGGSNAETIMAENPGDFLTEEELHRRAERAVSRYAEIKAVIDEMPSFEAIHAAMSELGAPMTPEDLKIDADIISVGMHCGKDYRTRYSLFKTLDEIGMLKEYLKDYPV